MYALHNLCYTECDYCLSIVRDLNLNLQFSKFSSDLFKLTLQRPTFYTEKWVVLCREFLDYHNVKMKRANLNVSLFSFILLHCTYANAAVMHSAFYRKSKLFFIFYSGMNIESHPCLAQRVSVLCPNWCFVSTDQTAILSSCVFFHKSKKNRKHWPVRCQLYCWSIWTSQ